jgi:hypothetical protein
VTSAARSVGAKDVNDSRPVTRDALLHRGRYSPKRHALQLVEKSESGSVVVKVQVSVRDVKIEES